MLQTVRRNNSKRSAQEFDAKFYSRMFFEAYVESGNINHSFLRNHLSFTFGKLVACKRASLKHQRFVRKRYYSNYFSCVLSKKRRQNYAMNKLILLNLYTNY